MICLHVYQNIKKGEMWNSCQNYFFIYKNANKDKPCLAYL